MFSWLEAHQLNIMLGLSSVCVVVGIMALLTRSIPKKRKRALAHLEFAAGILLYSDRLAYVYHGVPGDAAYHMVRISNFLVFFMTISVVHSFNLYLADLCRNEMELNAVPMRLRIVEIICAVGWLMVVISQFTGLYYYFDENNAYQRGPGFLICYIIPFLALLFQLSVIIQYVKRLSLYISVPLLLFTVFPMVASIFQALFYGVSLTNMAIVGLGIVLYAFAILELNEKLEKAQMRELDDAHKMSLSLRRSFEQLTRTVVNALDERGGFRKGHSLRVAAYSREIAGELGMDDRECFRVYYSAALHDIGYITLPDSLTGKSGRLTESEEEMIRKLPEVTKKLLSQLEEQPYLKTAALYHTERYDGKGYPEGLKGEAIPLTARIVAVADAYDELTSYKEGREPMAQGKVRELLTERSGREFDPKIVDIMIGMIDRDTDYLMRETDEENVDEADRYDLTKVSSMHFDEYKQIVSDGLKLSKEYLKIKFEARPDEGFDKKKSIPAVVLFDSLDTCVHRTESSIRNLKYFEFGEIWLDGHAICTSARDIKANVREKDVLEEAEGNIWITYEIESVNLKDHVRLSIKSPYISAEVTVALPDATRFVYLGLTGEHCSVRQIHVKEVSLNIEPARISRIAPEVNYFTRKDGDIANVEVDGYREAYTPGLPVADGMRIFFRTQTLPIASLVHHCAYVLIYSSEDGNVDGNGYREYACIRLDGDDATDAGEGKNKLIVHKSSEFAGWDYWKEKNRKGLDYEIDFRRRKNRIRFTTENAGISLDCTTILPFDAEDVRVALTGDLCTLMDIRIRT